MNAHKSFSLLAALLLATGVGGCASNVCEEAADLCGASARELQSEDCQGAVERLAECLVDKSRCTAAALAECSGVPALPGSDAGVPLAGDGLGTPGNIALTVDRYQREPLDPYNPTAAEERLLVDITIRNDADGLPVSTSFGMFSLETNAATILRPEASSVDGLCDGSVELARGGKHACVLPFAFSKHLRPTLLHYRDPAGRTARASFPAAACAGGEENTAAACRDGCDNDGNGFADCAEFGCCAVRTDCPADSTCARKREKFCATEGGEYSLAACSDGCDNDRNLFYDCGERSCCDVRRDCPADTYCGRSY